MKQKIQKEFEYGGFGFPITLVNVPMIEVMGVWTPHINYNKLQKVLLLALAHKPGPLTGNELRFLRKYFELNMETFGKLFGVTHAAVSKWENKGDQPLNTDINTERCLRLFIMDHLDVKDEDFRRIYKEVADQDITEPKKLDIEHPFHIDAEKEELMAI